MAKGKEKGDKKKDKLDKIGNANREAWEAARGIAKTQRKEEYRDEDWSKLPWREIRRQLHESGNVVDMTAVPTHWTSESPQMTKMRLILEEAGFIQDEHLYVWQPADQPDD